VPAPAASLAPYAAHDGQSRGRRYPESPPEFRSEFQRDRDRIIHSNAFRRLVYKTQVFVNHEGDLYRTRVTHSIEVAQIARSVALALRLNEALTGSDLPGPRPRPYSLRTRRAGPLNECMHEYGGFEHNCSPCGSWTSSRSGTRSSRGSTSPSSAAKAYSSTARCGTRASSGNSARALHPAAQQPGLEAQIAISPMRSPTTNHDVDDGIRAQLLDVTALREVRVFRRAVRCRRGAFTRILASAAWCTKPSGA